MESTISSDSKFVLWLILVWFDLVFYYLYKKIVSRDLYNRRLSFVIHAL